MFIFLKRQLHKSTVRIGIAKLATQSTKSAGSGLPVKKVSEGWDDSYLPDFDVILPKTSIVTNPDPVLQLLKAKNMDSVFARADNIPDTEGFNFWIQNSDFDSLDYIVKRMVTEEVRPNASTFTLLATVMRKSGKSIRDLVDLTSKFGITLTGEFYMVLANSLYSQQRDALNEIPLDNRSERKVFATLKFDKIYEDQIFSKRPLLNLIKEFKDEPKKLIVVYNMLLAIHANPFPAYLKVNSAQYMLKNSERIAQFQALVAEANKSKAIPNLATFEIAAINSLNLMDLNHCSKIIELMEKKKLAYNLDIHNRYFVACLVLNDHERANTTLETIVNYSLLPPENAIIRHLLTCFVYSIPTDNIDQIHEKYSLTLKLNTILKKKLLVNDNLIAYRLFSWMFKHGYKISPNAHQVLCLRAKGTSITIPPL